MDGPADIMWAGEDPVEWDMEVENTGRAEATVVFAASERDDPGCAGVDDFSISFEPSSVSVASEETEPWSCPPPCPTVKTQRPSAGTSRRRCRTTLAERQRHGGNFPRSARTSHL
ncbi:MAG: hypothetical protein CM15mP79_3020 [Methanobacteriota archaeon]|nr:MAG: hypothetical protein CM15mP79_3020 [Euryarchaeota archaeon]